MGNTIKSVKDRLKGLISEGYLLLYSLGVKSQDMTGKKQLEADLKKYNIKINDLPDFNTKYESWYSEAIIAIKMFLPDRISDFVQLYKNDKRKQIDFLTYTIADSLIGLEVKHGLAKTVTASAAIPKLQQQISILSGAEKVVESVINSLQFDVRADLFDSELDAAQELIKAGFYRAGGAMCGVVLEKHFTQVCLQHQIPTKKKEPTISEYNDELKQAKVIDLTTWRNIQLLGDLRNKCCHDKKVDPTKDDANDLLTGTKKIIKTVF